MNSLQLHRISFLFFVFFYTSALFGVTFSSQEKEWIKEHPVVRLGADYSWPPYEFVDKQGRHTGIAADFLKLISQKSGLTFAVTSEVWADVMRDMKAGKFDGLSCAAKTPKREKFLKFTTPYVEMPLVIVTQATRQDIKNMDALNNKTVAVNRGSYLHEWLQKNYPNIHLYLTSSNRESLKALSFSKVDAYIGNIAVASYIMKQDYLSNLKIVNNVPGMDTKVSIAIDKNKPVLFAIIEKSLQDISDKERQKITDKWFEASQTDTKVSRSLQWSEKEQRWLQQHKQITLCIDPDWMPFEAFDKDGKYIGISAEYFKEFQKNIPVPIKVVRTKTWSESLLFVQNGRCEILSLVVKTPQREKYLHFTKPYLHTPLVIATRPDVTYISSMEQLEGKKVAIVKDYSFNESYRQKYPKVDFIDVKSITEGLQKVQNGELFGYIGTLIGVGYQVQTKFPNQLKISGQLQDTLSFSVGIKKDLPALASIFEKVISAIKEEDRHRIESRWIAVEYAHGFDYKLLWKLLAGVVFIIAVFVYWNRKLALEIKKREKAQEELLQTQHRLQIEKDKAEAATKAKSEFLSNMSHEIRTPLNAIIGFSDILSEKIQDPKLKSHIKTVKNASHTLLTLINDILDLSKIEAGKLIIETKPTNLFALADEVGSIFAVEVERKNLDFVLHVNTNIPKSLLLDEVRIRQILLNLIGNAIKFTQKGFVKLSVRAFDIDQHLSKLNLEISVEDSGIGIPKEQLAKIFNEFEQMDGQDTRKFGGTGLGLSISKRLCEMMGGNISVESQEKKGTVFKVHLYNVSIASIAENDAQDDIRIKNLKNLKFKKAKILVVDDIESNRDLIVKIFENTAITVITAKNGLEAIALCKTEQPDLVLMDIKMPEMDGYEVTTALRKISKCPVIALTASLMENEQEYKDTHFDGFLRKPVLKYDLFVELSKFLAVDEAEMPDKPDKEVFELSEKAKQNSAEIRKTIEEEIQTLYKKALQTHSFSDTKDFSKRLCTLAAEYDIKPLEQYALQLQESIEAFDIKELEKLLERFDTTAEDLYDKLQ
ncbi:transporter substrate-binding domain-containing protein [Sulfurimonas hydrogeniphila]|uniref:transporter substrate-binding domain-containing protein n=1 Tax=Sulfurimonas hydrogeniphila TaxID=2509341 RepID=UPI00165F8804|nr:transporter substrate-binding domain-containing protein [Sulfurimonas hydrogeniphila]